MLPGKDERGLLRECFFPSPQSCRGQWVRREALVLFSVCGLKIVNYQQVRYKFVAAETELETSAKVPSPVILRERSDRRIS
jgi:hypothetical protein